MSLPPGYSYGSIAHYSRIGRALGHIPRHWRVEKHGAIAEIAMGMDARVIATMIDRKGFEFRRPRFSVSCSVAFESGRFSENARPVRRRLDCNPFPSTTVGTAELRTFCKGVLNTTSQKGGCMEAKRVKETLLVCEGPHRNRWRNWSHPAARESQSRTTPRTDVRVGRNLCCNLRNTAGWTRACPLEFGEGCLTSAHE